MCKILNSVLCLIGIQKLDVFIINVNMLTVLHPHNTLLWLYQTFNSHLRKISSAKIKRLPKVT